jgi:hypothetical protein
VRALDRDDVAGLLDDADELGVAALVLADRQRGSSARLKQISHRPMRSLTSRMASASALASSASRAQDVEARRCAVRWPIPGSLPSSVMRRWTGGRVQAR